MADRVVRYKIEIDGAQVRQEARQVAQTFARELNAVQTQVAKTGAGIGGQGGLDGLLGGALGGLAGYFTVRGISSITMGLAALNAQAMRSTQGFIALSGGAAEAQKRLEAIQRASGGTMDKLTAMNLANRLVALGMAKSAGEMEKAVETGRKIATVMGGDVQGALENLSLAAANLSFMRLDQMGISATKVRERMKELTAANAELGKEQAFLQAAMEIANETFKDIDTSQSVSNVEALTASWADLRLQLAEGLPGQAANAVVKFLADTGKLVNGQTDWFAEQRSPLRSIANNENIRNTSDPNADVVAQKLLDAQDKYNALVAAGVPGLERYKSALIDLSGEFLRWGGWAADQQLQLQLLTTGLDAVASSTGAYAQGVASLGDSTAATTPKAQELLAQLAQLDINFDNGKINLEGYNATLQILLGLLGDVAGAAPAAGAGIDAAFRRQVLLSQGYKLDAEGNQIRDPRTGQYVLEKWAPGYDPATNSGQYQLEYDYQVAEDKKRADAQAAAEWQRAAEQTAREMQSAAEQMVNEFKGRLDSIPGLTSTSQVTEADMAAAAAGVYQEKPDEWLRQLAAEVQSGKDEYPNADIRDAAVRAGIDPNLDPKVIYAQVAAMWNDSSFFARGKNTDVINQGAVQAALARQDASASGKEAIYQLFGITPEPATSAAALASGLSGGTNNPAALAAMQGADAALDPQAVLAGMQAGFATDASVKQLRDIGYGMAGHLYAGFAQGVDEQDWAAPILGNFEARLVAQTVAAVTDAMQK